MKEIFATKSAKVLVVDEDAVARSVILEALAGYGFSKFYQADTITTAAPTIMQEKIEWVISAVSEKDKELIPKMLASAATGKTHPFLTTLMLKQKEEVNLPEYFEKGLFSWIRKPITRDGFPVELNLLFTYFERSGWDITLTAARYVHKHLIVQPGGIDSQDLSLKILQRYPGNAFVLLMVAESQTKLGHIDAAVHTLKTVKMLEPKFRLAAEQMLNQEIYASAVRSSATGIADFSIFGITNACIVSRENVLCTKLSNGLEDANVSAVREFDNSLPAFEHISGSLKTDMLILDWAVNDIPPHSMLQKIRRIKPVLPIFVISSTLDEETKRLFLEVGVTGVFERRDVGPKAFEQMLTYLLRNHMQSDYPVLERNLRQFLAAGNRDSAQDICDKIHNDTSVSLGQKRYAAAEMAYFDQQYQIAQDLIFDAVRFGYENVLTVNLLAKTLIKLGNKELALKCFVKAQHLSPKNIDRICQMAELHLEANDTNKALDLILTGEKIDANEPLFKQARAKVALINKDEAALEEALSGLTAIGDFIAFMNNKAVTLAHSGAGEEAIQVYQSVVNAIADTSVSHYAVVQYNLALSHIRMGHLLAAETALKDAATSPSSRVSAKVDSLLKRVSKALQNNGKLELVTPAQVVKPRSSMEQRTEKAVKEYVMEVDLKNPAEPRAPFCCYGIFVRRS